MHHHYFWDLKIVQVESLLGIKRSQLYHLFYFIENGLISLYQVSWSFLWMVFWTCIKNVICGGLKVFLNCIKWDIFQSWFKNKKWLDKNLFMFLYFLHDKFWVPGNFIYTLPPQVKLQGPWPFISSMRFVDSYATPCFLLYQLGTSNKAERSRAWKSPGQGQRSRSSTVTESAEQHSAGVRCYHGAPTQLTGWRVSQGRHYGQGQGHGHGQGEIGHWPSMWNSSGADHEI